MKPEIQRKIDDFQKTCVKGCGRSFIKTLDFIEEATNMYKGWVQKNCSRPSFRIRAGAVLSCVLVGGICTIVATNTHNVGYPVLVDNEVVGYATYPEALDKGEEINAATEAEIKMLSDPVLYSSSNSEAVTLSNDDELSEAIADKTDQEDWDILNQLTAEWVEPEIPIEERPSEPAALIDESLLDNASNKSVVMDIPSAKSIVSDNSEVDLLNITEKDEDKITAYCVYIDDKYIGTVEDPATIEETLNLLQLPYMDTEGLIQLRFSKNVTYDKTVEISRSMLTDPEEISDQLLSTEGVQRIYEVVPGDCPSLIADKLDMTTDELLKCPVTLNGEVIPDLSEDCRVGMQIQYGSVRKFIHVLVEKDTVYTDMIPYETEVIEDDDMLEGEYQVRTEGEYGMVARTCREIIDDDVILKSKELSREQLKEPVKEVIIKGTKEPVTEVNTSKWAGGSGDYFWPVGNNEGYISAYQGDGRGHKGIDIAAPYGTPIYAATSGYISSITSSGWGGGYGKHVLIKGNDGYVTMYAHMSYTADKIYEGMEVVAGQLIGYVGSTGDSTGNHLHFEVRNGSKFLNPTNFVSQ